ncbi:hypothetical protein C1645_415680 [Glomus cerebriforme]|uniref:Uncharacterized protein n=1 Tax=Glomus cerebriforme TaxID=658196 RepID=A0A397SP67_9GLOM|nr:hypothetical protein C1645_415680 [Glomus cerebriforme]
MNESEKELVQYLKLNYGLIYKNRNFIPSKPIVSEGQLKLEKYTDQIWIYEPIQDNSSNSVAWDSFINKFAIKDDDNSLKFEKNQDQIPLLAVTDIKLIIPVLKITYSGNYIEPPTAIENNQEFLSREVLVGGFLIIRNVLKDYLEFDRLKAHIAWAIYEACWESKNLLKSAIVRSKLKNVEDLNGNPIHDMETLSNYLNQIYKFETAAVISYEKVVPVEKKNNNSFDARLIPGITNYHQAITIKDWVKDNIHLNLPFWIKEYQFNHAMVVTSHGLVPGTKPALEFLSVPSIKWERKNGLKISILQKELLYSKIYLDEIDIESIQFLTPFDITSTNVIQCNVFHGEVVITIWEKQISKPSQQLVKDIKDALNDTNPYKSLTNVFSEYGHVICTEITLGGRLSASSVNDQAQGKFCQCLKYVEWTELKIIKDLLKEFNMDDQNFITYDNSDKNLDEINTWLKDISKNPNLWSLANQPKLISLYEILDDEVKRQIQNLLENKQILMTGITKLSSKTQRYYRVNFNNYLLTNNDYQIIGSVIMNNERLEILNVKFQMKSISGFSIIIEEYKKLDEEIRI